MGLRNLITDLAKTAVDATGDIPEKITYVNVSNPGDYDPAMDSYGNSTVIEYDNIRAIPIRPRYDQDDYQSIQDNSTKFMIAMEDMSGFSENDYTLNDRVIWKGNTFEVVKIQTIPTAAIFYIWVRNP